MSPELERMREIVERDDALREELWRITDPAQFASVLVRAAGERGILLVDAQVWEAFHAGRLSWTAAQTS